MKQGPSRTRGPHPADDELFVSAQVPILRRATGDLSWLLDRDYSESSALKLVGDRYQLARRQRDAIRRSACPDALLARRRERQVGLAGLSGEAVAVDGFNQLITAETGLSGGVILRGRDGACRDLAGVHGTWRRRDHSHEAIRCLGERLTEARVSEIVWYLDRPVSNSGRLRDLLLEMGSSASWPSRAEIVDDADAAIVGSAAIAISSDGHVLDHCERWCEVLSGILDAETTWIVDLGVG